MHASTKELIRHSVHLMTIETPRVSRLQDLRWNPSTFWRKKRSYADFLPNVIYLVLHIQLLEAAQYTLKVLCDKWHDKFALAGILVLI